MTDEQLLALNADFSIHIAEMGPDFYAPILCSDYMSLVARLEAAEAVCAATVRLESAFDIQDKPNNSPAERNLARCLNVWRAAKGNK